MRADSGIIYFNNYNVLIYLFSTGEKTSKPVIAYNFVIEYDILGKQDNQNTKLMLVEKLIDIISSDQASGIYKWKLIFQSTKSIMLDEIRKMLDFSYEILDHKTEQELICKGIIFDFV